MQADTILISDYIHGNYDLTKILVAINMSVGRIKITVLTAWLLSRQLLTLTHYTSDFIYNKI